MNSKITIEINGYIRNILRYNYQFSRNIDHKGRPSTGVLDGGIYVEMESGEDCSILDMMLVDMNKHRSSFFSHAEPIPVSGRIRHTKDNMMLRELIFDEAYIVNYGEKMIAEGSDPMITRFLISPTRLDINRNIRLDRRIKTTYSYWWEEYKEEKNNVAFTIKDERKVEKEELPECTVSFRRCKDYDGSFGFDWLRVGDTDEKGCDWYRNTMHNVSAYDRYVSSEYRSFNQQWREKTEAYKATSRYIIPWVTLMEGNTATFRIKMEVNKPSGILDVKIVGGGASALSADLKTIEADKTGDYYYTSLLNVKCNSTFSQQTAIEVRAKGELVGKMIFVPNNKLYDIDIAIITVKTKTPQGQVIIRKPDTAILEGMKRLLQQAYIVPHFKFYDLDLSQTAEWKYDEKERSKVIEIEKYGGKAADGKIVRKIVFNSHNSKPLFNLLWRIDGGKIYLENMWGTNRFDSIHNFLNKMLYFTHKVESSVLESMFKLYFINEILFSASDIGGQANRNYKNACISCSGYTETITTHELLHLLSLEHPFEEKSKYFFNKFKTENIMDYEKDEKVNEKDGADDRISLWHWQIKQIWDSPSLK